MNSIVTWGISLPVEFLITTSELFRIYFGHNLQFIIIWFQ